MKDQNNVDTTQTTTCLEWCAGYGGISLGLKRAIPSLRTIAFGEIEAFACANLVAKMEAGLLDCAPIWTDIKTFPYEAFRDRVDILVAGYPCQPFSAAGKRLGTEDPRHLWPHIARSISIIRPRLCFFENVEGHISLGLSTVISDLEELGYKVSWGIFSASEVGAPHQRKRVFILAECIQQGLEGRTSQQDYAGWLQCETGRSGDPVWPSRPGEQQFAWEPPRVVANSERSRGEEPEHQHTNLPPEPSGGNAETMGNAASQRPRTLGAEPAGQQRQSSFASTGDAMGNTASDGRQHDQQSKNGREARTTAESSKDLGNADYGRLASGINAGSGTEANRGGQGDFEQAEPWQVERTMGLHSHGTSDGLGHAELSGLCDSELAEIREWMVKCDNRTDELRLLGNGVVPATAERAFLTLLQELTK